MVEGTGSIDHSLGTLYARIFSHQDSYFTCIERLRRRAMILLQYNPNAPRHSTRSLIKIMVSFHVSTDGASIERFRQLTIRYGDPSVDRYCTCLVVDRHVCIAVCTMILVQRRTCHKLIVQPPYCCGYAIRYQETFKATARCVVCLCGSVYVHVFVRTIRTLHSSPLFVVFCPHCVTPPGGGLYPTSGRITLYFEVRFTYSVCTRYHIQVCTPATAPPRGRRHDTPSEPIETLQLPRPPPPLVVFGTCPSCRKLFDAGDAAGPVSGEAASR